MTNQPQYGEIPITLKTNEPQQLLSVIKIHDTPSAGDVITLDNGLYFRVDSVTDSHGFVISELIISGVISLAVGVSTQLLTTWLKEHLFPHRDKIQVIISTVDVDERTSGSARDGNHLI